MTQEEVDNFLDIYPEAFVDEAPDGPVVKYNNEVMEHIEQLSAETEEVTAYIEEAYDLNKKNKEKTNHTFDVMNNLSSTVEQLSLS